MSYLIAGWITPSSENLLKSFRHCINKFSCFFSAYLLPFVLKNTLQHILARYIVLTNPANPIGVLRDSDQVTGAVDLGHYTIAKVSQSQRYN
ncbi:hypothetical protein TNCV_2261621 [Trichonephila clavipes]|nr:hypothetical protein TNCV_2261621 [Trichonephila clavipes]